MAKRKKEEGQTRAELMQQLQMAHQLLGMAVAFRVAPYTQIEARRPKDGEEAFRWAIVKDGQVMDRKGHWETEPGPAARTDALRDRYYYTTVTEALEVFAAHCVPKQPAIVLPPDDDAQAEAIAAIAEATEAPAALAIAGQAEGA